MISYTPNKLIQNVVIFGVGGSGARVASLICQQLMTEEHSSNTKVILMDGDVVETKNCRRQLFIPSDVGKNKSDVIANRYRKAFKSNVISIPKFFPSTEDVTDLFLDISNNPIRYIEGRGLSSVKEEHKVLLSLIRAMACKDYLEFEASVDTTQEYLSVNSGRLYLKMSSGLTVFVLAVDSIPARLSILDFITKLATIPNIVASRHAMSFRGSRGDGQGNIQSIIPPFGVSSFAENLLVIDGGNEDSFGQVCYFHPVQFSLCPDQIAELIPERSPYRFHTPVVPMPTGRYLNMEEGTSTRRCGDMDQTLAINNLVATCMHVIFQNLFYNTPMTFNRISFGLNGAFSSEYMSFKWLKGVLTTDKNYLFGTLAKEDTWCKGVSNLQQVQGLSKLSRIKYGLWDQPMNGVDDINKSEVVVGMLFGVSSNTIGDRYESLDGLEPRYLKCNRQSDLLAYLDAGLTDKRSLRPKWSEGDKGLCLLVHTTFLDVSWSEILGPIFHKHAEKGLFSGDDVEKLYATWKEYGMYGLTAENPYQAISLATSTTSNKQLFLPAIRELGCSSTGIRVGYSCVSSQSPVEAKDILYGNRNGIVSPRFLSTDTYELSRVHRYRDVPDEEGDDANEDVVSTGMALVLCLIKDHIESEPFLENPDSGWATLLMPYGSVECVGTVLQSGVDIINAVNLCFESYIEIKDMYDSGTDVLGIINSMGSILTQVQDIVTCLARLSVRHYMVSNQRLKDKLSILEYGIVMYLILANGRSKMIEPLLSHYGKDLVLRILKDLNTLTAAGVTRVHSQSSPEVSLGLSNRGILSLASWIRLNAVNTEDLRESEDTEEEYEDEYDDEDEEYNDDDDLT